MSSDTQLQEMEVGTKEVKGPVNANAAPGDQALPKAGSNASGVKTPGNQAQVEDLGGPTPDNYSPTNDSAKLKPAGGTLKQVRDIVNKNAEAGDPEPLKSATPVKIPEDAEVTDEVIEEDQVTTDEVVEEVATEEEVVAEAPDFTEISIDEDVNALVEGEELSEEFKEKAKTILEAAVKGKVVQIKEVLSAEYDQRLVEEVEEIKVALNERVDSYLEYVSDEWFTENQLAVERGLKEELTESFMTGLKGLFEEHYVSIPEEKYDVLESMVEKLDDMETKLNEQIEKNVSLNKRLGESQAGGIFDQVSEGIEFESDNEYREKLVTLRESYFPGKVAPTTAKTETLSEGMVAAPADMSGSMAQYLKTMSMVSK